MSDLYKLGWLPDGANELPYEYPDVWAIENTTGPDRLVIATKSHYVRLLLELARFMDAPYGVLYVLTVPRGGGEAGRYQHPSRLSFDELELFLYTHQELLEQDARNSIWIQSASGLLVYDLHNVIYAYGPLESFKATLNASSLHEIQDVRFPSPHTHRYHFQHDETQANILREVDWIVSPLRPGDENPNDA
jgi:hypothetical protein